MNVIISFLLSKQRVLLLALALFSFGANAALCPISPTQYADVSIPNPDPAPNPGEWPEDMSQILSYVNANNITTVKDFLSHMPLNLKKHYSFIKNTGALNVTSLQNPGLLPWGSGSRFMMNVGTTPGTPLYEVVDLAQLKANGEWDFRSLDFRGSTPVLSPHGGVGGECRECHGLGSTGGNGPLRPILGNYLFWTGFFSDSNGASGEDVTAEEKPILDAIKNGQHNMNRWHAPLYGSYLYAEVGVSNMLPDHAYGPGLTIFNTELASAATESIHKRIRNSPNYAGLREEMLLLSYCDGKQLSSSNKNAAFNVVQNAGGSPQNFISYNSWAGVYQALGLDPMHEFPLHIRAKDRATTTQADMNWNTGVSALREGVDFLILMELAQENSQIASMLNNNPSSYSMTGGCSFPTLKSHFDHKMYALYTLKGNARQKARESYYDIDYMRIHSSMNYITGSLCSLLGSNIGPGTIGNPNTGSSSGGSSSGGSSSGGSSSGGSSSGGSSSGGNALQNGVPKTGLSASTGSSLNYTITVPSGASNLVINISGGSGDADLYTRFGSAPTDSSYTCRPYLGGNNETCTTASPNAGVWYVRLKAYSTFSGVTLTASYSGGGSSSGGSSSGGSSSGGSSSGGSSSGGSSSGGSSSGGSSSGGSSSGGSSSGGSSSGGSSSGGSSSGGSSSGGSSSGGSSSGGNVLQNGVPKTGLSASTGSSLNYTIAVPSGASNLVIKINGGSGDADLYTRFGSAPTDSSYTCRPYVSGNNETCTTASPSAGVWHVRLKAYSTFSGVTLTASYSGGSGSSGGSSSGGSSSGGSSSGGSSSGGSSSGGSSSGGSSSGGSSSGGSSSGGSSSGGSSSGGSSSGGSSSGATLLGNGVPITNLSGATGSQATFYIHVHGTPPSNLNISISGGSGDADLYVRQGAMPTTSNYDCRPYIGGNSESCSFATPVAGPYFIMIRGYSAYSGVTLSGNFSMGGSSSGGSSSGGSSSGGSSSGGSSSGGNEYGLQNACSLGRPPMSNTNISLGQAICAQNSSGQTNFKYTPVPSDAGKDILFTIGHGSGVAGLTANQDFNAYATQANYNANPGIIYGSFGLDPLNVRRTYNRVIVPNVQLGKDIWISLNASGSFSGVALKGEVLEPVDSTMPNACAQGSPPITDQYVTLGQAVCGQSSQGQGFYTHFIYRPTTAQAGQTFILETAYGTGHAEMTVNQHYSSAPTSGGTAFAHEEHLADRPDLVFSSARPGVTQRVVYPNATAQTDIFVVIPPGPAGYSTFTFRIRAATQ